MRHRDGACRAVACLQTFKGTSTINNKLFLFFGVVLIVVAIEQLFVIAIAVSHQPPASSYQWGYLTGRLTIIVLIALIGHRLIKRGRRKG